MTGQLLTAAGGTRAWRERVAFVLVRDGYTCRMLRNGHVCGAVATTANHRIPRALGGSDALDNLEAACVPCNMAAGGRLTSTLLSRNMMRARQKSVSSIVATLDRLGLPYDAGRRRALAALAAVSRHPWRRADVDAACGFRRTRGPLTRI